VVNDQEAPKGGGGMTSRLQFCKNKIKILDLLDEIKTPQKSDTLV
jgi:hypothetical protein